jgi:hypothetical protein
MAVRRSGVLDEVDRPVGRDRQVVGLPERRVLGLAPVAAAVVAAARAVGDPGPADQHEPAVGRHLADVVVALGIDPWVPDRDDDAAVRSDGHRRHEVDAALQGGAAVAARERGRAVAGERPVPAGGRDPADHGDAAVQGRPVGEHAELPVADLRVPGGPLGPGSRDRAQAPELHVTAAPDAAIAETDLAGHRVVDVMRIEVPAPEPDLGPSR